MLTVKEKITKAYRGLQQFLTSNRFLWALLGLGVVLRLNNYFQNRSLWIDEAWVAMNILSKKLSQLFTFVPLFDDWCNRPIGFTFITKCLVLIGGNNEYMLRLYPLLAGIASLFLFRAFIKRHCSSVAAPIAMGLFALSHPLIFYSAELKQYSCDVFVALILYNLLDRMDRKGDDLYPAVFLFGLAGWLAVWNSLTSVFVLAGIGLTLMVSLRRQKQWAALRCLNIFIGVWIVTLSIIYNIALVHSLSNTKLIGYWREQFIPLAPFSVDTWHWIGSTGSRLYLETVGITFPILAFALTAIGGAVFYHKRRRQFFFLFLPFVFVVIANLFRKYPLFGRLVLFTAPAVIIFLGEGAAWGMKKAKRFSGLVGLVIICLLFSYPVKKAVYHIRHGYFEEQAREAMQYLVERYRPDDLLMMNMMGQHPFSYYGQKMNFFEKVPDNYPIDEKLRGVQVLRFFDQVEEDKNGVPYGAFQVVTHLYNQDGSLRKVVERKGSQLYKIHSGIKSLKFGYKRGWLYTAHMKPHIKEFVLGFLDRVAERVETHELKGAAVYLYHFEE